MSVEPGHQQIPATIDPEIFNTNPKKYLIKTSDGVTLELLYREPNLKYTDEKRSPVLILPDLFHPADVYAFNIMPFIAQKGRGAFSLSWRGHGGSALRKHSLKDVRTRHFERDLDAVLEFISSNYEDCKPIIIAHGAAAAFLARYVSLEGRDHINFPVVILISPINIQSPYNYLRRVKNISKGSYLKAQMNGSGRPFISSVEQVGKLFFTDHTPVETSLDFWNCACSESFKVLKGLRKLKTRTNPFNTKISIFYGESDKLVTEKDVDEMAELLGAHVQSFPEGHDFFTDCCWQERCEKIVEEIQKLDMRTVTLSDLRFKDPKQLQRDRLSEEDEIERMSVSLEMRYVKPEELTPKAENRGKNDRK